MDRSETVKLYDLDIGSLTIVGTARWKKTNISDNPIMNIVRNLLILNFWVLIEICSAENEDGLCW